MGSQAAVKRAGAEKREADVSAAARDRGKASEKTHSREGDVGMGMCAP